MTLGQAIKTLRNSVPMTQKELVAKIDGSKADSKIIQDVLSRFEQGERIPTLRDVCAIEEALGVPRGQILIMAGYVEGVASVLQAIAADPELTESGKSMMRQAYQGQLLVARHGADPQ